MTLQQQATVTNMHFTQGRRQRGATGARPPPFKICAPHFTFGLLVAAYIQYSILKMCPSFWFLAPLLLNPGDGPGIVRLQSL